MALRSYMPRKSIGAMPSCLIRRVCRSSLLPELPVVFRGLLRPPAVTVRKSPSFGRLLFKALFFVEFGLEYLRVDNCLAQVEILRNFRYSLRCRMLVPCCVFFVQDFFVEMPSVRSVFASGVPPGAFEIGRFAGDFTRIRASVRAAALRGAVGRFPLRIRSPDCPGAAFHPQIACPTRAKLRAECAFGSREPVFSPFCEPARSR